MKLSSAVRHYVGELADGDVRLPYAFLFGLSISRRNYYFVA
jgi:hypothetical protein